MEKFISNLREKPENHKKRILFMSLIVSMFIIVGLWVYSLTHSFSPKQVVQETKEDAKPFNLLGLKFKDMYQNITASAGKAKINISKNETTVNKEKFDDTKVIDLIPVNK